MQKVETLYKENYEYKNKDVKTGSVVTSGGGGTEQSFSPVSIETLYNENVLRDKYLVTRFKDKAACVHLLVLEEMKLEGTFVNCDICQKQHISISWGCRICDFDVCIECHEKEFANDRVYCDSKHLLVAKLTTATSNVNKCDKCKKPINQGNFGNSFICEDCKYSICLNCYLVKQNEKKCIIF